MRENLTYGLTRGTGGGRTVSVCLYSTVFRGKEIFYCVIWTDLKFRFQNKIRVHERDKHIAAEHRICGKLSTQ